MLAPAAFPALFLCLAGFVLFLMVTLSVLIIDDIPLFEIRAVGGNVVRLGVFGACYLTNNGPSICTDPAVGYTLDPALFGDEITGRLGNVVVRGLAGSLVVNPIAAGFAGMSFVLAFFAWFCSSRILEIFTFLSLLISSLAGWLAFWLDLALVLLARARVRTVIGDNVVVSGHIGMAVWMALGGMVALTFAICAAGLGTFGRYSNKHRIGGRGTY